MKNLDPSCHDPCLTLQTLQLKCASIRGWSTQRNKNYSTSVDPSYQSAQHISLLIISVCPTSVYSSYQSAQHIILPNISVYSSYHSAQHISLLIIPVYPTYHSTHHISLLIISVYPSYQSTHHISPFHHINFHGRPIYPFAVGILRRLAAFIAVDKFGIRVGINFKIKKNTYFLIQIRVASHVI